MIRSALRSVSFLVEDVASVAKWAVGELVSELDYRLQPEHVRQGWAAAETLNDIEAGIDSHEPNAPYLQWGGPETWPLEPHGGLGSVKPCSCGRMLNFWASRDYDHETWLHADDNTEACSAPYCNRCGYPHPTTQTCLRDESSAVPPAAERPSEVSAAPPIQTPSEGHPIVEVIAEVLDEWHPWEQEDGLWQCSVDFCDYDFIDLKAWRSYVANLIAERIDTT